MDISSGKIKNILVATDFSKNSDYAIARAIEIAKIAKADITLLHVVEKKYVDTFIDKTLNKVLPEYLWLTTEEYKKEQLQEQIRVLAQDKLNIKHAILPKGRPAIKILHYAKKYKIDLLIIGAHGKYSIRDTFVGTTAEYLVQRTKCPVLIVKNRPDKTYQKILLPVDFSDASKIAVSYALYLFENCNIRLIHVGDHEYEDMLEQAEKEGQIKKGKLVKLRKAIILYLDTKLKAFISKFRKTSVLLKQPCIITLGYPAPIILNEATRLHRDLIIMGTQGHAKLHYLFIGSVASRVLTETDKDILLIPPMTEKR